MTPVRAGPDDEMTDEEIARLDGALERGFDSIKDGRFRSAADVIADLRAWTTVVVADEADADARNR